MVELTDKQKLALYKKSQSSGFSTGILEEVYSRGYNMWDESFAGNAQQFGFDRVNSFIAGGFAAELDSDLLDEGKRGLWDNIHAKRKRIAAGSGERMRKPGEKGAPTAAAIKAAQNEAFETSEKQSKNPNDPSSRFDGTSSVANVYARATPGQKKRDKPNSLKTIKKVIKEARICENCNCGLAEEVLNERGADSKGYKRSTESGAGLTAKGAAHYRRQNPGSKLSTAVTEKNPTGKRAARRRSFCARMSGVKGPMKDEKGRPTRKAMSLRRWRC